MLSCHVFVLSSTEEQYTKACAVQATRYVFVWRHCSGLVSTDAGISKTKLRVNRALIKHERLMFMLDSFSLYTDETTSQDLAQSQLNGKISISKLIE